MKFNTVLKTLGLLAFTSPLVFAGDCDDIEKYLNKKDGVINFCKESKGKVVSFQLNDSGLTEKDIDKIFSYDSIKSLDYNLNVNPRQFEDKPEEETENDVSRQITKLTALKKLKNLESLEIYYDSTINGVGIGYDKHYLGQIAENTLKDLTSLKSLSIVAVKISQKNIEEISTLKNLESLNISLSSLEKSKNFESLSKLENLKSVKISSTSYVTSELVNAFKSIKELDLYDSETNLKIDALPNVEKITWDSDEVSSLGKLPKLAELYLHVSPHRDHDISSLESLSQIKKLTINASKVYPGSAGPQCQPLTLKFADDAKLEKLTMLTVYPTESSLSEIKKLKNIKEVYDECEVYGKEEAQKFIDEANKITSSNGTNTNTTVPKRRRKCVVRNKSN